MKRVSAWALALTLALSLTAPAAAAQADFTDVPQSHWAYPYVMAMTERGVMTGMGGGAFAPEESMSTAQFSVVLSVAFCVDSVDTDTEVGTPWWQPYLDAAWEAGYLTDTTAGSAYARTGAWDEDLVTDPMTRYDMAQAMWNTVVAENMTQPTSQQLEQAQRAIGDFASVPEDYESAVVAMYALGYLSGVNDNGDFGGAGTMTRAQSCVAMCRLLGVQAETTPEATEPEEEPVDQVSAYEQQVFDLVNQIREENGLSPFEYNETLAQVARAHSQDMIDRNFFDHINPDGDDPSDRVSAAGIRWSRVAENIAAGQRTPEQVVDSWMNSPGHRANILGQCQELGVGLALGGSYGYYWTQCFATQR